MPRTKSHAIDDDAIARKAYELWEARACPHGDPEHDWPEAERVLRAREAQNGKKPEKAKSSAKKSAAKKAAKKPK